MKLTTIRHFGFLFIVCFSLFFAMASVSQATSSDFALAFNEAYKEANELRKQSGKLGHEWRDIRKLLKQAAEAAQTGDQEKAMKLVAEAKFQSEAAIVQANREQKLWEGRVIR